jgi:hypothetical protein
VQSGQFEFIWEKPGRGDGYEWAGPPSSRSRMLLTQRKGVVFVQYAPLREATGLFRDFADAEPTPEGVLKFANGYGCLGVPDDPVGPQSGWESLYSWRLRILMMRGLIMLWEALRDGSVDQLRRLIRWDGNDAVRFIPPPELASYYAEMEEPLERHIPAERRNVAYWDLPPDLLYFGEVGSPWDGCQLIASRTRNPNLLAQFIPGDPVGPARAHLLGIVNDCIARGKVQPRLHWSDREKRLVYQALPETLFGAMYLQLLLAIDGDRQYKRCRVCGRSYEVAGGRNKGISRRDRETCSNACRIRAYRERQEKARLLHAQGKSAKEIARELGTDSKTIREWIARRKG